MPQAAAPGTHIVLLRKPGRTSMSALCRRIGLKNARAAPAKRPAPAKFVAECALQADPGTVIVAAAGNDSDRPTMTAPVANPAACPSILAVVACDQDLAALWLEDTPKMTASELWVRMKVSARTLGPPADFGSGLVRVPGAESGAAS